MSDHEESERLAVEAPKEGSSGNTSALPIDTDAVRKKRSWRAWLPWILGFALVWVPTVVGLGVGLGVSLRQARQQLSQVLYPPYNGDTAGAAKNLNPTAPFIPAADLVNASRFDLNISSWDFNAQPTTRYYNFTLEYVETDLDGFRRPVIAINKQLPGPTIEANVGDRIIINVTNNLLEPTTIHSHGIFQNGTPWFDGIAGVSQCPIPVGWSMTYNYTVTGQDGTYWYHSHFGAQYNDGAFGALIIHNRNEPGFGTYDDEKLIFLGDWYHRFSNVLTSLYVNETGPRWESNFTAGGITEPDRGCSADNQTCHEFEFDSDAVHPNIPAGQTEPIPVASLINGRAQWNCTSSTGVGCGGARSVITFQPNKRYRLRLITGSAYAPFMFSVDNHKMQIIEADGASVNMTTSPLIDGVQIAPGQRYSVIVNATQPAGNYFARSRLMPTCSFGLEYYEPPTGAAWTGLATVNYLGVDPTQSPTTSAAPYTLADRCFDPDPSWLAPVPALAQALPTPAQDNQHTVSFQFIQAGPLQQVIFNVTSWVPLIGDATLFEAQQGIQEGSLQLGGVAYNYPSTQFVIPLADPAMTALIINSNSNDPHPFHLHGQTFWVVGIGNGVYNSSIPLNTTAPPVRDTAQIPSNGWIAIWFNATNPGLWAVHCHFSWHVSAGLLLQFAEVANQIPLLPMPPETGTMLTSQCEALKSANGGRVVTGIGK